MNNLRQDIIDRNAYRRSLELNPQQDGRIRELLASAANTLAILRPDTASLALRDYRLSENFRLDTDVTVSQGELHGTVGFRDIAQNSSRPLGLIRNPSDPLWATTVPVRTTMATTDNYPNQAIIDQIRNYAPTLPVPVEVLEATTDVELFRFLVHALRRNGGKRREHTQVWRAKEPQPDLGFAPHNPDTVRKFEHKVLNGSPSYSFTTRTPALPTLDGNTIAVEHRLSAKNVNRKDRKVELSIIHHGLWNAFDEQSLLTALYAARGSDVHPDDAITAAEESLQRLIESIFTIDRLN